MSESEMLTAMSSLTEQIVSLKSQRRQLSEDIGFLRAGVKAGDIVTWNDGAHRGTVLSATAHGNEGYLLSVRKIKKNGELSKMTCGVSHWHAPTVERTE